MKAVLFALGYRFYNAVFNAQFVSELLDIIFAFVLLILFSFGHKQNKGIKVFVLAIVIGSILSRIQIISYIFRGL
jgi:riboflavin transporter FmnP